MDDFPPPSSVHVGQRVGFGMVQHRGRGWYLVTSDGQGMYGNEQSRGWRGCDCTFPTPRMTRNSAGELVAVEYEIVGEMPARYVGSPRHGTVCAECKRAMRPG